MDGDKHWLTQCMAAVERYRMLTGDHESAFKRVDSELAKAPALKPLRLLVKGKFLILFAWEAHGNGYANTVTADGGASSRPGLPKPEGPRRSLAIRTPATGELATLMITVKMGGGWGPQEHGEVVRATMKADPNNLDACPGQNGLG